MFNELNSFKGEHPFDGPNKSDEDTKRRICNAEFEIEKYDEPYFVQFIEAKELETRSKDDKNW